MQDWREDVLMAVTVFCNSKKLIGPRTQIMAWLFHVSGTRAQVITTLFLQCFSTKRISLEKCNENAAAFFKSILFIILLKFVDRNRFCNFKYRNLLSSLNSSMNVIINSLHYSKNVLLHRPTQELPHVRSNVSDNLVWFREKSKRRHK